MKPSALLAASVAIIVLIGVSAVAARGPTIIDCTVEPCSMYVPLLAKPAEPTATPTITPIPTATPKPTAQPTATTAPTATLPPLPAPAAPCDQNAPAPAEGAQAWMTITSPARFSNTTLCVRLIIGGQVVSGQTAHGVAHYKTTNTDLGTATTGNDGVAHMTFSIGGASSGFTVGVDADVSGRTAHTSFTPQ